MPKSTKSMIFSIIVLAATVFTMYFLNQLDQIVHGQLYSYGLQFDFAWANPYWNILRIIQVLLGVAIAAAAASLAFTIKKDILGKKPTERAIPTQRPPKTVPQMPTMPRMAERQTTPPSQRTAVSTAPIMRQTTSPTQPAQVAQVAPAVRAPTPQEFASETSGPMRCPHCGKAFTQPLRMLDFQGDRPRIVNICPFCNEIIQTAPKQESEEDERFHLRRKNNHTPKPTPSQPSD